MKISLNVNSVMITLIVSWCVYLTSANISKLHYNSPQTAEIEKLRLKFHTQELKNIGDCSTWKEPKDCINILAQIHNSALQLKSQTNKEGAK